MGVGRAVPWPCPVAYNSEDTADHRRFAVVVDWRPSGDQDMKIVEVRIIGLSGGTVDGGWPQGNKPEEDLNTLLEVVTDEGLVGVGSCMTSKSLVQAGVQLLLPHLLGERADEPARVTEKLRQSTFWQGRGGAVEHAISGLDIALWDLFGKITNQPVSRLLGGNYRTRIKPYGSILFDEPGPLRETLQATVARGFRAIKLGWRPFGRRDARTDELLMQTARDAVGPNVELMVDAGGSEQFWPHGYKWARNTAKMLANYGVVWFEEALPPDDLEGFIELRRHSPVPIATGEVLTRRQSFRPFLERHAVDIIQPDCTKCGGLTEAWRIGWMAPNPSTIFLHPSPLPPKLTHFSPNPSLSPFSSISLPFSIF